VSPLAKFLAVVGVLAALVGVVGVAVVVVLALTSDDPLSVFAVPIVAFGVMVVVAAIFLFAVMAQGVSNLRRGPEE
jgi:hypothetical protein